MQTEYTSHFSKRLRVVLLLLISMFGMQTINAQSHIGTAGSTVAGTIMDFVSYNIGEPVTKTLIGGSYVITQGYIQPIPTLVSGVTEGTYCAGTKITVSYSGVYSTYLDANSTYTVELSDALGAFTTPTLIATRVNKPLNDFVRDTIQALLPYTLDPGINYRVRVATKGLDYYSDDASGAFFQVNPTTSSTYSTTRCNEFTWNNVKYTQTGTYTSAFSNIYGCDSLAFLNIKINYNSYFNKYLTHCGTYNFNNQIISKSGDYQYITTNFKGCDSIVNLNITIKQPTTASFTQNACVSYTWHGQVLKTTGEYRFDTTNVVGCDSVEFLKLEIKPFAPKISTPNGQTTFPEGGSLVITASGGGSYTWNTGASTSSITAITAGNYTVTISNSCGVSVLSVELKTTNGVIPIITLDGEEEFCSGTIRSLTASGGSTFKWSTNETTSKILTGSAGIYTVTVFDTQGNFNSTSVTINVLASPTITLEAIGGLTPCFGDTIYLKGSGIGTFKWENASINPERRILESGIYTLTLSNDFCTDVKSMTVQFQTAQIAKISTSGSATFCGGGMVELISATADTYLWSTGANTQRIQVSTSGIYALSVTNVGGCQSLPTFINVTVNPLPTKPIVTLTNFELSSTVAGSYQWYRDGNAIVGATSKTYQADKNGIYFVEVANEFGCKTKSEPVSVTGLGVDDGLATVNALNVYPNPFSRDINVYLSLRTAQYVSIQVSNMLGQDLGLLLPYSYMQAGNHNLNFDMTQMVLRSGIYFIKVRVNDELKVIKVNAIR